VVADGLFASVAHAFCAHLPARHLPAERAVHKIVPDAPCCACREKLLLHIRIANTSALPEGTTFMLQLRVVDFLDMGSTTSHRFTTTSGDSAPQISLPGGPRQGFAVSKGVRVQTALAPASLCAGRQVEFSWSTDLPGLSQGYSSKDLLVTGPLAGVPDGAKFFAEVSARFYGSSASTSARVALTARRSPLVAQLEGTAGDIGTAQTVTLSAARSFDPDDLGSTAPLTFSWECIREDYPKPCYQVLAALPPCLAFARIIILRATLW
jgi:hypothetical protein